MMPSKTRQKWKILPDFPLYEINQYGDVRHADTKLRLIRREQLGRQWYPLRKDSLIWIKSPNDLLATIPEFSF